jgi:hypothetical protein
MFSTSCSARSVLALLVLAFGVQAGRYADATLRRMQAVVTYQLE